VQVDVPIHGLSPAVQHGDQARLGVEQFSNETADCVLRGTKQEPVERRRAGVDQRFQERGLRDDDVEVARRQAPAQHPLEPLVAPQPGQCRFLKVV